MTYCLALTLDAGLVLLADSRTNAGVDNVSTFGKLFTWSAPSGAPNARAVACMSSGNLSVTQEVINLINEEIAANGPAQDGGFETILTATSLFRVANRFGEKMLDVQNRRAGPLAAAGVSSGATLIIAGQLAGQRHSAFLVYSEGNSIETTPDTPFLQIGEIKYGKPILDRVVRAATPLSDGVKAAFLSMDATMRSNLSVGAPLDLATLEAGTTAWRTRRVEAEDPAFTALSQRWGDHLRAGFDGLSDLTF